MNNVSIKVFSKYIMPLILSGFETSRESPEQIKFHKVDIKNNALSTISDKVITNLNINIRKNYVCIILPTYAARSNKKEQKLIIMKHIKEIKKCSKNFTIILVVAIQWRNYTERIIAFDLLKKILGHPDVVGTRYTFGLTLKSSNKNDSINAVVEIFKKNKKQIFPMYWGWFDDDVFLKNNCVKNMLDAALKYERSVIGANTKRLCRIDYSSRILYKIKNYTEPPVRHPQGCAIIVPKMLIKNGLPNKFTEDGYICFKMIDPKKPNPFEKLKIVENSICEYYVGAGKGLNYRRIRRAFIDHWMLIASFPDKCVSYLKFSLFSGLWPLSKFNIKKGITNACIKWCIKLAAFVFFLSIGFELFIRGLFKRPIKNIRFSTRIEKA